MTQPTSRETFKDYCKRKLGHPVVELNLDDDQIEDAIDPTWSTNSGRISARAEVEALISSRVANFSRDELVGILDGIPNSPVNTISEALADPQSIARGILTEYNGVRVLSSPLRSLDN